LLAAIAVPYADTRAAELSWALGLDPVPAQAEITVASGPFSVVLRVLGASHQVELRRQDPSSPGPLLVETVACLPGEPAGLPQVSERPLQAGRYTFESAVLDYPQDRFRPVVEDLRQRLGDDEHSLVGVFSGAEAAVTALRAVRPAGDGIGWRSWHAYPQTGEIVMTRSEVMPA
jgi:hypothetical protein